VRSSTFAERIGRCSVLALLALAAVRPACAVEEAEVAWLQDGKVELRTLARAGGHAATSTRDANDVVVPLGSLWKLFVFAYLADTRATEPAYACTTNRGAADEEERYCCPPGESIARAQALSRSCAPYFAPVRLGIDADAWRAYWQRLPAAQALQDLAQLKPETNMRLRDLLAVLDRFSPTARADARSALLETGVEGYGREAWQQLGTGIRYKTYSWHRVDGSAFGGAAGWLADGTPFWFGARGSSRSALAAWGSELAATLPAFSTTRRRNQEAGHLAGPCVDVDFFARYPLRAVWAANASQSDKIAALPGEMKGRFRLEFANGNWLVVESHGELVLTTASMDGRTRLSIGGRFDLNEYVARVIDREGSGASPQAARALAIAARSYLTQNARFEAGCWRIADASATQRVSPQPPSRHALAAAWFTDEVVLKGVAVRYHADAPAANRLVWRDAVAQAGQGWDFERILLAAYPTASIASLSGQEDCARLAAAESWLTQSTAAWSLRLAREPGFEPPREALRICALDNGNPYSDQQRLRIYVRGWRNVNERLTLAHEYLHLAFRFHPNGADEAYIERLAHRLIEG